MVKSLRYSVLLVICLFFAGPVLAQFPYTESFRNSTAPGITFGGAPSAFLTAAPGTGADGGSIDPEGQGYLRLTDNTRNQKGYIYSNAEFPSYNGLSVIFEYYIYGGTGADGISLFLFDATADPFVIGGFGGSLGYAQITTTTPVSPGVSKGYLAIGLDEYGNFSNPIEGRQGGIPGLRPGSVTLRGKGNGAALTADNYKFLWSVRTADLGFSFNPGNVRQPDSTLSGYRRVYMDMAPNPGGGYNITVRITRGGPVPVTTTVIDNYYYAEPAPQMLRYGIASSTGLYTNYHEIRNVFIDVYEASNLLNPVAGDDALTVCAGNQAVVDVTVNDTTANEGGTINKSSIDLDPSTAGTQSTYTVAGKGTFSFNSDGNIIFTPESAFTGTVTGYYTVKDSYGKTSDAAVITLTYVTAPTQPDAGQDTLINTLTSTTSYILKGNDPQGSTGRWSQVSGPNTATFSNANVPNALVSNLTGGIYVFRWTIATATGCELYDDVQLTINRTPVAVNDTVTTALNTFIEIPVLNNDTDRDGNETIDKSSVTIKANPQHGAVLVDPATGIVRYRPEDGYSGYDSFVYTIKDNYGAESTQAIVYIAVNVKPEGSPDNAFTVAETPVTIRVLDNDQGRAGAAVLKNTDPANGTIAVNADGTVTYTPVTGFSGFDTFTYRLQNQQNLISDPITVTVNVRPAGSPDNVSTTINTPVTVSVKDNDVSKTGTTVIPNVNPEHGSITVHANGTVTYTPQANYSGTDTFSYRLRTEGGLESDAIVVTITVSGVTRPAKIGLAKALTSMSKNPDGSYNLQFTFTLVNYGDHRITNLSLTDDLAGAFQGAGVFVRSISATGTLQVNNSFNGVTDRGMLLSASYIAARWKEQVELELTVTLNAEGATFYNSALVQGTAENTGNAVQDQSTNGLSPDPETAEDPSPAVPTPVKLEKADLFIPGGFSPNGDGINDYFVIENALGKKVSLEVYNRWGNRIFRSADYQNNWNGRCTEGIHVGEDVPVGTYYYIIVIDNGEKQVGYLTINR